METSKNHCHTNCTENCSNCTEEINGCPVCGNQGLEVLYETVENLVTSQNQIEAYLNDTFYLCLSKACHVAYFTSNHATILLNQINVPIWFKRQKDEYYVCYCRRITLDDIIKAVQLMSQTEIMISDVLKYLNKEDVLTNCKKNNPTGLCCNRLFENAIKHAVKHQ